MKRKLVLGGIGAVLAVEPFTEILIVRAIFPTAPAALLVLVGIILILLAVKA